MKSTVTIALVILFTGLLGFAAPTPPSAPHPAPAPQPAKPEEYSYGNEMMKQIMASIRKDKFNLYLNFDISIYPSGSAPTVIDVFEMQAIMLFKTMPEGISVPLLAPNPKATDQEKKLMLNTHLDLSNRYGVIRLNKGEKENEFVGDITFYSKIGATNKLVADKVKLDLNSQLLDIKRLYLYGAKLRIQLPGAKASKEEIKRGLVKALLECNAETDIVDDLNSTISQAPLQKCAFSFDGELLRLQYRESKPTYLP